MSDLRLFVATPTRGGIHHGTHAALFRATKNRETCMRTFSSSLLTLCFNSLWCQALNERPIDYFAMIHDDIIPVDDWWVDRMIAELRRTGADVLSVAMPIKDDRGLTSTAFMSPKTGRMRRLTMTELCNLPGTFTAADAGYPGHMLLPNTGLWVCDFTKPWVEKICFTNRDRVFRDEASGEWMAQCFSEDWDFGVQCAALGLNVVGSRVVKASHVGEFKYPNFTPFGTLKTDDAHWQNGIHAPAGEHEWPHLERKPLRSHKRALALEVR